MEKNRCLKLAICDDEKALCTQLEENLQKIARQLNVPVQVEVWYSGEGLREDLAKGNKVDAVFLDIELMKLSGIQVGTYIRDVMEDMNTQIIYISWKTNYAMQLFQTQPFDFLVKPITYDRLYQVMKKLVRLLEHQNHLFCYKNGREICQVPYDDILYFRSDLHKVTIVKMHETIEFYGKLREIAEQAPPQFISIHKSYLVNRNYVEKYTFSNVFMKNKEILNISKAYQKSVREMVGKEA